MGRLNLCITCIVLGSILVSVQMANADSVSLPTQLARQWSLFNSPWSVAVDTQGNVYVADYYNWAIKKISTDGSVRQLGDNIQEPEDLAVDSHGNVYVAGGGQYDNNKLYKIYPNGTTVMLADNMSALASVCVDSRDNVYYFHCDAVGYDLHGRIDELYTNGTVRNVIMNVNGTNDVFVDTSGNIYMANFTNNSVEKISNGTVKTIIDNLSCAWSIAVDAQDNVYVSDNNRSVIKVYPNGSAVNISAGFICPKGLAVDASGAVYVADQVNNKVKKIYSNGTVVSLGYPFNQPECGVIDSQGNVYVADKGDRVLQEIYGNGSITTRAGDFKYGYPNGITMDPQGNLYVSECNYTNNGLVKKIDPSGKVTILASGFSWPAGLALDSAGNVYVAESGYGNISRIALNGTVSRIGGIFNNPMGVAVDASGNVYVGNTYNYTVNIIYPNGTRDLYAGSHVNSELGIIYDVAIDRQGIVYVACHLPGEIKAIYPNGTIVTLIDGLNCPVSVSINDQGHLCVIDFNAISEYVPPTPPRPTSYTIALSKGWNLVSLPIQDDSLWASNISASSGVDRVAVFNGNNQSFSTYTIGVSGPGQDFKLVPDRGYFINCTRDNASLTFYGMSVDGPRSLTLQPGWNLVGWTPSYSLFVKTLCASSPYINKVARYNASSTTYNTYIAGASRDDRDFDLSAGNGYFVYSNAKEPIYLTI